MRKITFFLTLLFAFTAMGSKAQTTDGIVTIKRLVGFNANDAIADPASLQDGQAFVFKHVSSGKYLKVNPKNKFIGVTATAPSADDPTSGLCVFTLGKTENGYTFESALTGNYIPAVNTESQPDLFVTETPVPYTISRTMTDNKTILPAKQFVITSTVPYTAGGSDYGSFDMFSSTKFTGWAGSGSNCAYQIIPVTLGTGDNATVSITEVTYEYYIGGRNFNSSTAWQEIGAMPAAPNVDYANAESYVPNTAVTANTTYTVNCSENLPFEVTTDVNNPKLYTFNIHRNQGNYMWQYNGDDENISTVIIPLSSTTAPADKMLWYLTGNLVDGFKIYNVAAGKDKVLTFETGNPHMRSGDGTSWKIRIDYYNGGACFSQNNNGNYINRSAQSILAYHSDYDAGSGNFFYPAASFQKNYLESQVSQIDENAPAGAVGGNPYFDDAEKTAVITNLLAQYETAGNKFKPGYFGNYATEIAAATYTLEDGYYRIVNAAYSSVLSAEPNGLFCKTASLDAAKGKPATIIKIAKNDNGTYTLGAQDKFFGNVERSTTVGYNDAAQEYTITNSTGKKFVLQGTPLQDHSCLHHANRNLNDNVVGWNTNAAATFWYIVPATELEVALTPIDGASYATAYLPFAVQTDGKTQAYTAEQNAENINIIDPAVISDGVVPAGEGVILKNENGGASATLSIVTTEKEKDTNNVLTGTCMPINGIAKTDYYIFGNTTENGLGFYRPNVTTLAANKAFIDNRTSGVQFLKLNFGGDVTGIGSAAITGGDDSNAPVFDLSGRRVERAAKGIYIRGGKKIYVK